jgi:hypothetical protein
MNYQDYVTINPDALDDEWVHFPSRYMEVIQQSVEARIAADEAKDRFDLARARADDEIRKEPESFDIPKVTENAIKNAVELHPKVLKAKEAWMHARKEQMILQGAVDAMDAKRKALENIVQLQISGMYAEPKGGGKVQAQMKERVITSNRRKIRERMNQKE